MKTLHLVRHAEAARGAAGVPDHDRALTGQGREDARRLGAHLRRAGITADLVLCSTARRARETLEQLGFAPSERHFEERLYGGTAEDLLARLREVPEGVLAVLLVGHNPAVHQLARELVGAGSGLERLAAKFPAGTMASLVAPVDRWADLSPAEAELARLVLPSELE